MEYFNGGSLFKYIAKHQDMSWEQRIEIALAIAKGMNTLISQKQPIVHRDLKSPNVILKVNDCQDIVQIAITDFGQSMTTYAEKYKQCQQVECPYWLAPEVIETTQFELESDVYSFGMILWELTTLSTPFPQFNFMEEVRTFIQQGNRLEIPYIKYKEVSSLIEECWKEPDQRPTFVSIIARLTNLLNEISLE